MQRITTLILALAIGFSLTAAQANARNNKMRTAASITWKVSGIAFLASIIPLAVSYAGVGNTQMCPTNVSYCCKDSTPNGCVVLSPPDGSCPSNQAHLCENMTVPQTVRPDWASPLGITSAVVMGVSGGVFIATSIYLSCRYLADNIKLSG